MIVYCCADLLFATKIRSTADVLGVVTRPARDAEKLQARLEQVEDGRANGPVAAVLVDLEMGQAGLTLVAQARAHDPRLPVVAFGSHVMTTLLQQASEHGASMVLARSAFTAQLPDLLRSLAAPA